MRIAICDDEVSMVQILEEKIKKLLPDAVIDKYLSGDELIASGSKPDILFLDIQSSRLEKDEKYIMVQTAGSHIKIFLRDIVYAEVFNRKVIIHTRNTDIEYYGKLQDLQNMAGEDFFRTHRAYLVHFKYVEKYDATCVTMKNGTALIAKQNYPEFVRRYLKYNQRKGNEVR